MARTYEEACAEFGWPVDQSKLAAMRAANGAKMEELEGKIKDAEENLGDTEVGNWSDDAKGGEVGSMCRSIVRRFAPGSSSPVHCTVLAAAQIF